jgi:hypothetical protein
MTMKVFAWNYGECLVGGGDEVAERPVNAT